MPMTITYPSPLPAHRHMDMAVHGLGLTVILAASAMMAYRMIGTVPASVGVALWIYIVAGLVSNLASWAYHFLPWHNRRLILRRLDHAMIYVAITGTFTPFLAISGTSVAWVLIALLWALSAFGIWNKLCAETVKGKWSTASYLVLGSM